MSPWSDERATFFFRGLFFHPRKYLARLLKEIFLTDLTQLTFINANGYKIAPIVTYKPASPINKTFIGGKSVSTSSVISLTQGTSISITLNTISQTPTIGNYLYFEQQGQNARIICIGKITSWYNNSGNVTAAITTKIPVGNYNVYAASNKAPEEITVSWELV